MSIRRSLTFPEEQKPNLIFNYREISSGAEGAKMGNHTHGNPSGLNGPQEENEDQIFFSILI